MIVPQAIGQDARRPYLAMAGEYSRPAGGTCDVGFSCLVGDHISFDDQGVNLTRYDKPEDVFDQLFERDVIAVEAVEGTDLMIERADIIPTGD